MQFDPAPRKAVPALYLPSTQAYFVDNGDDSDDDDEDSIYSSVDSSTNQSNDHDINDNCL